MQLFSSKQLILVCLFTLSIERNDMNCQPLATSNQLSRRQRNYDQLRI